jgi:SAM-dependent methyltransferase
MALTNNIKDGHYAKKQLHSQSRLIAWSHRSRFETGLRLSARFAGQRLIDYGCGDGTFLALLMDRPGAPASAVGADLDDGQVNDCRARFGFDPRLSFVRIDKLNPVEHPADFDGLVCMEVLEHVIDWAPLFDRWRWLVRPGGTILVSVPVETGPALALKQAARRVAGWRRIGDYPGIAPYTWGEYLRSLFAGEMQHIDRPVHPSPDGGGSYCHKGFNWLVLRAALARLFVLEQTLSSPLAWLPPGLGSQVWFVLRNRESIGPWHAISQS